VSSTELGAYGLRLPGLPGEEWLGAAPASWPSWTMRQLLDPAYDAPQIVTPTLARVQLQPTGMAEIDRIQHTTTIHSSRPAPAAAWAHPLLASTAVMTAEWAGRLAFHAGAFLDDHGRAWGLIGDRGMGKSTALAWLAAHDHPVLSDDLLITDGREALAGPRCVDLRESAAETFGIGADIGVVGTRRRWRVKLPPIHATCRFGGVIALGWGSTIRATTLPIAERAPMLRANRGLLVGQDHPMPWLHILAAPMIEFTRPQDWRAIDDAMDRLLEAVNGIQRPLAWAG